jgi:ASC-1-like (ASCH) protein
MLHHMKLQPKPFEQIKTKRKTVEIRLNDEKRQKVKVGDGIEFTNMQNPNDNLTVKVTGLTKAKSLQELFEKVTPYEGGWDKNTTPEQAAQDMRKYYSAEKEQKYGGLGIHVEPFSDLEFMKLIKEISYEYSEALETLANG